MVKTIGLEGIRAREAEQQAGIFLREEFRRYNDPTQQAVINTLRGMQDRLDKDSKEQAKQYFFETTQKGKEGDVEWDQVGWQIRESCFGHSHNDYEPDELLPNRVSSQITVYEALKELPLGIEEMF